MKTNEPIIYRDDGKLLCLEADLTHPKDRLEATLDAMLDSPFAWLWWSEPRDGVTASPETPLRRLTAERRGELMADHLARDHDGYGRFILNLAVSPALDETDRRAIEQRLRAFAMGAGTDVHMTLHQLGDSRDFLTLPRAPAPAVMTFLERVGLQLDTIRQRRRYGRLGVAALESVLKGLGVSTSSEQ